MKLNYFYGSINIYPRDGYNETLEFSATEQSGKLEFRYPYGQITPEQAEAVSQFTKTVTDAYNVLQSQINRTNKRLKLEEYAPIVPPEVKTAGSDFDLDAKSATVQSCALGDGEVSTGADGDIDKPKPEIVITKVTEEDSW